MKQLIIIGEGQTEQEFCRDVLFAHFFRKNTNIHNPTIKKTKGGIVSWPILKKEIENYLISPSVTVTTLIDYYGIKDHHNFPKWKEAKSIVNRSDRMSFLEKAMKESLKEQINYRFIPYIQLHEFEALLFADDQVFDNNFESSEFLDYSYLKETLLIEPEDINDGNTTAPSKRLERIIKGYNSELENNKVFYGSLLAQEIGLTKIREKCPRFNNWITQLETI